jgi:O-antigen ligase
LAEGRSRNIRHRLYRVSWVVAFMAVFYMLQYRDAIFEFVGKSPDASGRGHIWYEVGKLIAKRPMQGWGWIGYWMPGAKPLDRLVKVDGVQQYHAHDAYLDVTMQLGVIGLLLFLLMLALSFIKLWRLAVRHNNALYLWPLLVFSGILVLNITESRMLVENGWMIIVLFMVKVNEPKDRLEPSSNSVPPLKRLIERINQLRQRLRE